MSRTFCPGGVHFDGSTYLHIASLTATDSPYSAMSFWYRAARITPDNAEYAIIAGDAPSGFNSAYLANYAGSPSGRVDNMLASFGNDSFVTGLGYVFTRNDNGAGTEQDVMHHVLIGADLSTLTIKMLIDGVDRGTVTAPSGSGGNIPWNGLSLYIGADTIFGPPDNDTFIGDLAEVWVGAGQNILDGSGDITPTMLRKFNIDGCPVDLGADGSTPTGTAAAAYFSRPHGAAPSVFATNRGTGGTFTLTGSLTTLDDICACLGPDAQPCHPMVALIPARVGSGGEGL